MKTSNKLLIAVTFIVISYLTVYDLGLKAEYHLGAFKNRFYHMQSLSFNNFNVIEQNAGNKIDLQIEKGPYDVRISNDMKDKITVTQHNQTLSINYINKAGIYVNGYQSSIIITCPYVSSVTSKPFIMPGTKYDPHAYNPTRTTTIIGFNQPKMNVEASQFTEIELKNNTLGELGALVGDQPNGKAHLALDSNNHIKMANLQVPGKSNLSLRNLLIDKVNYKLTDSATITLTGKAAHMLTNK
jgi:hypothetical protein